MPAPISGAAAPLPKDFITEVRRGNIAGLSIQLIAGHAEEIGTAFTTVAPFGTPQVVDMIPTAQLVGFASTDAKDASPSGDGLRTFLLTGLDDAGNVQTETITLTGQTKTTSANTYTAIHGMTALSVGDEGDNAGTVYCGLDTDTFTAGVPDTVLHAIQAGWNISRTAVYTVPTGKTAYLHKAVFSSGPGKVGTGRVVARMSSALPWLEIFELNEAEATVQIGAPGAPALPAGASIRLDGEVNQTTGTFTFNAILLIEDV